MIERFIMTQLPGKFRAVSDCEFKELLGAAISIASNDRHVVIKTN
jgi:hypothetical protein